MAWQLVLFISHLVHLNVPHFILYYILYALSIQLEEHCTYIGEVE